MTKVRTASRSTGGVAMTDISRTPVSASCSVRGIGVAVSVSTCTSARSAFSRSLCPTPKCCSSSMMRRPRSLNPIALGEQRVRADDDVDLPVLQPFTDLRQLFRRDEPRSLRDLHREAAKALGESLEMLARQQRRGHDHRDLFSFHDRKEGGAKRHFGLAEADVAADEPVHRPALGEVFGDCVDACELIVGFLIGEAGDELVIEPRRAAVNTGAALVSRAAAILISSSAISRMRFFMRALRPCQEAPPSLSRFAFVSSEP